MRPEWTSATAVAALLVAAAGASASDRVIDPGGWLHRSDVVVGRLKDVQTWSEEGSDRGRGVIHVSEVIAGDVAPESDLVLEWSNPKNSSGIRYDGFANGECLWFYRRLENGSLSSAPDVWCLADERAILSFSLFVDRLPDDARVTRVRRALREHLRRMPPRRFDSAERVVLSDGNSYDVFARRGIYRDDDVLFVIRSSDGRMAGAFVRGAGREGWPALGLVRSRSYQSYAVIWDDGYSNLIALEVDQVNADWDNVAAGIRSKRGGLTAKVHVRRGLVRPREATGAERLVSAVGGLPPQFLAVGGLLMSIWEVCERGGGSASLEFLQEFNGLERPIAVTSREKLTENDAGPAHDFLRRSPLPSVDETGFVER